jgi:hemophore-related protein
MKLPAMLVLGALASLTVAIPTAAAAPCSASGLAGTASGVLAQASAYLDAHPGANDALTNAGSSGDAEGAVRSYFTAHPGEFLDLKNIARPLTTLRGQCGMSVTPAQLSALFEALSS